MIEITECPLSPERVIAKVRSSDCGCVVTYIGLIRDYSEGKPVLSVEYRDPNEEAKAQLQKIANEAKQQWPINNMAISHRIGKLSVGEIGIGEGLTAFALPHHRAYGSVHGGSSRLA